MIQSQTVVPVDFASANRTLISWHHQYRTMASCHEEQYALAWPDCQLFARAHFTGIGHDMYIVPIPPYDLDGGPAGYAIVDMDTDVVARERLRSASIREPYDTYQGALLTAAAMIATEFIDSEG
jgi:hypothetical protein